MSKTNEETAVSPARLEANRNNALFSTGPSTPEGKAISSLNAVKIGLTGRTVLLPGDDAEVYREHIQKYEDEFKPVGIRECELVQSLVDTAWRLNRIPGLEMALYAQGHVEFAAQFENHDPALRAGMIDLQTLMKYEKQFRNLHLQENRLRRHREKALAELKELQHEREQAQQHPCAEQAFSPATPNGFVFSNSEISDDLDLSMEAYRREVARVTALYGSCDLDNELQP